MSVREDRRAAALDRIADHMLANGLAFSSLRALGEAVGTSDRMLLYYFTDKHDIVRAAMQTIAGRLGAVLVSSLPDDAPRDPASLLRHLAGIVRGSDVRPYMGLWLELTVRSARGEEPYRTIAGQIADAFVGWVATRLDFVEEDRRFAAAARLVATVDGIVILDLVGREATADRALVDWPEG
jgi:AcrR family transcriptional regulator